MCPAGQSAVEPCHYTALGSVAVSVVVVVVAAAAVGAHVGCCYYLASAVFDP